MLPWLGMAWCIFQIREKLGGGRYVLKYVSEKTTALNWKDRSEIFLEYLENS